MTDLNQLSESAVGPVDLRLPADPSMSKVLRLAASGVASLGAFTVEEVEEIKLAVSEVLIALIEHGAGDPIDIRFEMSGDEFAAYGSTAAGPAFSLDHPDLALCRVVLDDVCSEHSLDVVAAQIRISATLRRPFTGL